VDEGVLAVHFGHGAAPGGADLEDRLIRVQPSGDQQAAGQRRRPAQTGIAVDDHPLTGQQLFAQLFHQPVKGRHIGGNVMVGHRQIVEGDAVRPADLGLAGDVQPLDLFGLQQGHDPVDIAQIGDQHGLHGLAAGRPARDAEAAGRVLRYPVNLHEMASRRGNGACKARRAARGLTSRAGGAIRRATSLDRRQTAS